MLIDLDSLEEDKVRYYLNHPQNKEDKIKLQQRCLEAFNFSDYKGAFKEMLVNSPTPPSPEGKELLTA